MRVVQVDPRDVTWEAAPLGYRVTFWRRGGRDQQHVAWHADEREVTGALAPEVVAWAEHELARRSSLAPDEDHRCTVGALLRDPADGLGVVVLNGDDPPAQG